MDILLELKTSNELAVNQTSELKNQTSKVSKQSNLIFEQLKISQQQRNITNGQIKLTANANRNSFIISHNKLMYVSKSLFPFGFEFDSSKEKRLAILENMKSVVDGQLQNPYLLSDTSLQNKWEQLSSNIRKCLILLERSDNRLITDVTQVYKH